MLSQEMQFKMAAIKARHDLSREGELVLEAKLPPSMKGPVIVNDVQTCTLGGREIFAEPVEVNGLKLCVNGVEIKVRLGRLCEVWLRASCGCVRAAAPTG